MSAVRAWLATRHSLLAETGLILAFYAAYEGSRGLVAGSRRPAVDRAHEVIRLEQHLHVFVEPRIQQLAHHVPGLLGTLSIAYLTLHLGVTGALLLWLQQRRPAVFPIVRTTLVMASVVSLIGFLAFPTAPPRMASAGLNDIVSRDGVDLNRGLVSALYNPYAAIPSMHAGYALVVGGALARYGRSNLARVAGLTYPLFVLLVIVATGNHFFIDAAAGALVVAVSLAVTLLARPRGADAVVVTIPGALSDYRALRRAA
jgi:PAP2 superfamily